MANAGLLWLVPDARPLGLGELVAITFSGVITDKLLRGLALLHRVRDHCRVHAIGTFLRSNWGHVRQLDEPGTAALGR